MHPSDSIAVLRDQAESVLLDDQPLLGNLLHKVYDRVKEFRLEYVEKGKEDAETYLESWDTADKKRLPRAIFLRLTIEVGDRELVEGAEEGAYEYTFERMIMLPGGDDTPEQQQQGPGQPGR